MFPDHPSGTATAKSHFTTDPSHDAPFPAWYHRLHYQSSSNHNNPHPHSPAIIYLFPVQSTEENDLVTKSINAYINLSTSQSVSSNPSSRHSRHRSSMSTIIERPSISQAANRSSSRAASRFHTSHQKQRPVHISINNQQLIAHSMACIDMAVDNGISISYIFHQSTHRIEAQYLHQQLVSRKMTSSFQTFDDLTARHLDDQPSALLNYVLNCWASNSSHQSVFTACLVGDCAFIDAIGALLSTINAAGHLHMNHTLDREAGIKFFDNQVVDESAATKPAFDRSVICPRPSYTPFTLIEWQLGMSATHAVHPNVQILYNNLHLENHCIKQKEIESNIQCIEGAHKHTGHVVETIRQLHEQMSPAPIPPSQPLSLSGQSAIPNPDQPNINSTSSLPVNESPALPAAETSIMKQGAEIVPIEDSATKLSLPLSVVNARPVEADNAPYDWSAVLPASVLPLLQLPNIKLPKLLGIPLPSAIHQPLHESISLARHARTFTRDGAYSVFTITLLPIELRLHDDEDSPDDQEFIERSMQRLLAGDRGANNDQISSDQSMFSLEWSRYDELSKRHCVKVIDRLSQSRVINQYGAAGCSVLLNDSDLGRATGKFIASNTNMMLINEASTKTINLQSVNRAYQKLMKQPAGHSTIIIGSYTQLWPLAVLLVNGDSINQSIKTETNKTTNQFNEPPSFSHNQEALAPKAEVRAQFERTRHGALTLQVWNPASSLNSVETALVNSFQQQMHKQTISLALQDIEQSDDPAALQSMSMMLAVASDRVERWSRHRTHPMARYCVEQRVFQFEKLASLVLPVPDRLHTSFSRKFDEFKEQELIKPKTPNFVVGEMVSFVD